MVTLDWEVVPNTQERIIINKKTGERMEFSDDPADTEQDLPIVGLSNMFCADDLDRLKAQWTEYELVSGGA